MELNIGFTFQTDIEGEIFMASEYNFTHHSKMLMEEWKQRLIDREIYVQNFPCKSLSSIVK